MRTNIAYIATLVALLIGLALGAAIICDMITSNLKAAMLP